MLGVFVVSGVLSERAIRDCTIEIVSPETVQAGELFEIKMLVENRGWSGVYGLENLILLKYPKYRLFKNSMQCIAKKSLEIDGKEAVLKAVYAGPLQRGAYKELILLQQTVFPFGILEKYKFKKQNVDIAVFPTLNSNILQSHEEILKELRRFQEGGVEFSGHARFDLHNWKHLDWKRNAFKRQTNWVVKVYGEEQPTEHLSIKADWRIAEECRFESEYEEYLQNIATLIFYAKNIGYAPILSIQEGLEICDQGHQLIFLANCPPFERRKEMRSLVQVHQSAMRRWRVNMRFKSFNSFVKDA